MATVDFTTPQVRQSRTKLFVWELGNADEGKPILAADFPDKTFQAWSDGAQWGGATLTLQGTLDERGDPDHPDHANAKWGDLTDTTETVISTGIDTDPLIQILQDPIWIRPVTTGGTNTAVKALIKAGGR